MCTVSTVIDGWRDPTWPYRNEPIQPFMPGPAFPHTQPSIPGPNAIPWPLIQQDPALAAQMLEVLAKLEALDKRLGTMEQCKVSLDEKQKIKKALRKVVKRRTTKNRAVEPPTWEDLRGAAPDATGSLSSEAFVRQSRNEWDKETACEHDLQKAGCTVEVQQLAKVQRGECTVCHEVWINPPYGALALSRSVEQPK